MHCFIKERYGDCKKDATTFSSVAAVLEGPELRPSKAEPERINISTHLKIDHDM